MKNLDNLYEAYQNYKKLCVVDNDTARFLRAYMNVKDRDSEDINTIFSVCHIEQDWVEAIETGIPFIEKAIREERQFIRNDGEVLPIEKIRKTSKASIQDLAKHANYITHAAPEGSETEVLPDKMLMIQKESDFAIYENRVLYAALMYIKDFVTSRLVEIKETTNTYLVKQHIKKRIDMGARKIDISLEFNESHVDDPLLTDKNQEKDVIDRLDEILTNILALLKTPLMREVSKVEMVSRPIAKTNILKMNRNFRESLACFEYIANYQGRGFTIEHVEKSLIPYSKQMNEAYTEMLIMLSFLNYMFANNIQDQLRDDYEEILRNRELQKENEVLAKLRDFKATADTKEQTMNEFLILFEQGYRILESRNDELTIAVKENEARRQKELFEWKRQEAAKIEEVEQEHNQHLAELENAKQDEIRKIKEASAIELQEYKDQFKDHIAEMEKENAEIKSHYQEQTDKIARLETEVLHYRLATGDTSAIKYAGEDEFDRLEKLKEEFDAFYEKAWKEAKKQIRKDVFSWKKKKNKYEDEDEYPVPVINPAPIQKEEPKPEPIPEPEPEQAPAEQSSGIKLDKEPVQEENGINLSKDEPIEESVQEENQVEESPAEEEMPLEEETPIEEEIEEPVSEEQSFDETPNEEEINKEEPLENEQIEEEIPAEENNEEPLDEPVEEEQFEESPIEESNDELVEEEMDSSNEEQLEEIPNEENVEVSEEDFVEEPNEGSIDQEEADEIPNEEEPIEEQSEPEQSIEDEEEMKEDAIE